MTDANWLLRIFISQRHGSSGTKYLYYQKHSLGGRTIDRPTVAESFRCHWDNADLVCSYDKETDKHTKRRSHSTLPLPPERGEGTTTIAASAHAVRGNYRCTALCRVRSSSISSRVAPVRMTPIIGDVTTTFWRPSIDGRLCDD